MKRCIAYRRSSVSRSAWTPCEKRAAAGSVFCRSHGEAVDGAVLGLIVNAPMPGREAQPNAAQSGKCREARKPS